MSDEDEYKDDMKETDPNFYKAIGKRRKNSPPMDFSEWNLFDEDEVSGFFKELLRRGFDHATENYQCYAWFACEYPEEFDSVPDATDMVVSLPIGATDDDSPSWVFSLNEMVDDLIDSNECGTGGVIDEEARPHITAVRDDLLRLSNKLDAFLRRKPKNVVVKPLKRVKPPL